MTSTQFNNGNPFFLVAIDKIVSYNKYSNTIDFIGSSDEQVIVASVVIPFDKVVCFKIDSISPPVSILAKYSELRLL